MKDEVKRKKVGDRIASFMNEKGITQKRFSEMTGISQSIISEMVNGKRNNIPLAQYIADNFGISLDWLINGVNEKDNVYSTLDNGILSQAERLELARKLSSLYVKHQNLMEQAQEIFHEIVTINKLLITGSDKVG